MKALVLKTAAASAAASLAGGVSIFLWTRSLEVVGLGLLFALFTTPAILACAISSVFSRTRKWRHVIYAGFVLPLPGFLLAVAMFPSEGQVSDGADDWALAYFITLVVAGIVGYGFLEWKHLKTMGRTAHRPCSNS